METPTTFEHQPGQAASLEAFTIAAHMAGRTAHDFNNILTGVLGNLELMQRRADRLGIADFNEYLKGAYSAASRGVAFSQMLLAISGHQALEPKHFDTASFVANAASLLKACFATLEITIICPPEITPLNCDEARLEAAFLQLAENAAQAKATAKLTISAQATRLDDAAAEIFAVPAGNYLALSVQDDGPGMSDDTARHAFEPFYSTKNATGLGLATILGFARQSGGHAFIAAHEPGNTKITLLLPSA